MTEDDGRRKAKTTRSYLKNRRHLREKKKKKERRWADAGDFLHFQGAVFLVVA